jgi:hypothetical protein
MDISVHWQTGDRILVVVSNLFETSEVLPDKDVHFTLN